MATNVQLSIDGLIPVLHPGFSFKQAIREETPRDFWSRANSLSCPIGPDPGTAWFLIERRQLNLLDTNVMHSVEWNDGVNKFETSATLVMVRAITMNRALAGDKNAARLVEFKDKRLLMKASSINSQYNVRVPAPSATSGATQYYPESLDTGSLWTWQTMLNDIWDNLPSIAGTAPTLPYGPDGSPVGWRFIGQSAWDSLHAVLDKVGCTTSYDPIEDVFTYVRLGTAQAGLQKQFDQLRSRLMYDYDPADDLHLGHMPETVRVWFKRRELYHGAEDDTSRTGNWEMEPVVSKDYSTGLSGALSGSVVNVWDDLPALVDTSGTNSNASDLQTRADEIGSNLTNIIDVSDERLRKMFSGLVNFQIGSQISEWRWRDFGDSTGLVTEVFRGPTARADRESGLRNDPTGLDASYPPLWPRLAQTVQVNDGASSTGASISANSDGLFPGFVLRWIGSYETLEACWIRPTDLGATEGAVISLKQKDRFVGRLSGTQDASGDVRPVYTVRAGSSAAHNVSADNGGPFALSDGDTLDFDATDQSFSTEANSTKAERGIVVELEEDGGDATIKRLMIAIDKSILQNIDLSGTATSGTDPVLVEAGTRNSVTFSASTGSPVALVGGTGVIVFTANDPFHTVTDDDSTSVDLDYGDELHFESDDGDFEVSKNLGVVTVKLTGTSGLPVGSVIMNVLEPILDNTKYYMDNGSGAADTNWALMDGTSNATPGSGVLMATRDTSTAEEEYFVRARAGVSGDATDTAAGRTVNTGTPDDDEVTVAIAAHDDHAHTISTDQCHGDVAQPDPHYDFSTQGAQLSTGVLSTGGGAAGSGVLGHTVNLTNHQGSSSDKIEMTPPHKKLYFFEKVA